jgi:signal transduction histidine kinase
MEAVWSGAVRQLCAILQQSDARSELLRNTELAITDIATATIPLEHLIEQSLHKLVGLSGATTGYFYSVSGDDLLPIFSTALERSHPALTVAAIQGAGHQWRRHVATAYSSSSPPASEEIRRHFGCEHLLIANVFPSDAEPFGFIILTSNNPPIANPFANDEVSSFVGSVANRLANTVLFSEEIRKKNNMLLLMQDIIECNFKARVFFKKLAHRIPEFLPNFGPFRVDPAILGVQILLYNKERSPDELIIRGTTGDESDTTRVSVKKSVTGRLILDGVPYIKCDPTQPPYSEYYKRYLTDDDEMHSELVVPIKENGQIFGAINIESAVPNIFHQRHVDALLALSAEIAPFVSAVNSRIEAAMADQRALGTALDNYFDHAGKLLRHGIATPSSVITMSVDHIESSLAQDNPLREETETIKRKLNEVIGFVHTYQKDVGQFSKIGEYKTTEIIDGAIEPIVFDDLAKRNITIDKEGVEDISIFCSPMLKQHVYNLVNNSLHSIEKRFAQGDARPGLIKITATNQSETDQRKEVHYNQRCLISIRDNGVGVSSQVLQQLRQFRFGVTFKRAEGGSGYGLYAAHEYIVNMLGIMELDSVEHEYFEVRLWLDQYIGDIHDVLVEEMGGGNVSSTGQWSVQ